VRKWWLFRNGFLLKVEIGTTLIPKVKQKWHTGVAGNADAWTVGGGEWEKTRWDPYAGFGWWW